MKKIFSKNAFLILSILYFLFISLYNGNDLNKNAYLSNNSTTQYISPLIPSDLFCRTVQSESLITLYNNIPRPTLKNYINQFTSCTITSEQLLFNSFSQYGFYSKNLIIPFKKTDIIFPFHNFW